jgi:hypothetical protein
MGGSGDLSYVGARVVLEGSDDSQRPDTTTQSSPLSLRRPQGQLAVEQA